MSKADCSITTGSPQSKPDPINHGESSSCPFESDDFSEVFEKIADKLGGISFGTRALAGVADTMGALELLANKVEAAGARISSALDGLATVHEQGLADIAAALTGSRSPKKKTERPGIPDPTLLLQRRMEELEDESGPRNIRQ